jgi:two-component system, chemotaxis family, response regulator WspF
VYQPNLQSTIIEISSTMHPLRIAIVNDTLMSLEVMRRAVNAIPHYQLAWTAQNGEEAVERCARDTPDLVLMDLLMPIMDGVEATRQIMIQSPCAILLVTASVNRFASKVFDAMGHGALDAVNTPILGLDANPAGQAGLLGKIATIAKLLGKSPTRTLLFPKPPTAVPLKPSGLPPLLLIGASTGGPQALATILAQIPADAPCAIAIVQHVDSQFAPGLAEWLNRQVPMQVKLSQSGMPIKAGEIYLAGSDRHLVVSRSATLNHQADRASSTYCPSVDMLFRSAASYWPGVGIGVLLTGMGRDGALGMQSLAQAGWPTIAQDEATSVVYGMPKAAVALKAAGQVLPIGQIALACLKHLKTLVA